MPTEIQRIADDSTVVGLVRTGAARLRSRFADADATVSSATETSTLTKRVRTLDEWTRNAWLYRWLTTEPEPEVIVIDLRETHTVGPFVALLDRLAPLAERTWRGSHAHRVVNRFRTSALRNWIAESKTVQLLAAALKPPEPPDENR